MIVQVPCPQCGNLQQTSDGNLGKRGKCRKCGCVFLVHLPLVDLEETEQPESVAACPSKRGPSATGSPRKGPPWLLVCLVAALGVCAVVVGGWYAYAYFFKSKAESPPDSAKLAAMYEPQLASMQKERKEAYQRYVQKSQMFHDSLLKAGSDLEVGINMRDWGNRIQDMNFQYNKWAATVSKEEAAYPSARLMFMSLAYYLGADKYWRAEQEHSLPDENGTMMARNLSRHATAMKQWNWMVASVSLRLAQECIRKEDVLPLETCPFCAGTGEATCPSHGGGLRSRLCPLCIGTCKFPPGIRMPAVGEGMVGMAEELTLDLGAKVKMEMVLIPAGKFLMGSLQTEKDRSSEEGPQHEVAISKPFYLGMCEVTQEQYAAVMGHNPSVFKSAKNPVEGVSWVEAQEFCQNLSAKTGKTVRLPTEAEWEYACRAGTKTRFCAGDADDELEGVAWYSSNSGIKAHPVGQKKPNAWGLYDMHGNVLEWCQDWYADKYEAGAAVDPTGAANGYLRVLRGGSSCNAPWYCRSAFRDGSGPGLRRIDGGFRVVTPGQK